MNTFNIESWCKPEGAEKSTPMGQITFRVSESAHLELEAAEDRFNEGSQKLEMDIDIDNAGLELKTPPECGELKDCKFHVYRHRHDDRAHFFLVAHRVSDNALVYSNAILVDQLG